MLDNNTELEGAILRQVEYYFSRQNLQNDNYLVSKMNSQMYVPLDVVAGFKLLKNLTQDVDLIKKVLRHSTKVQIDDSGDLVMIRPAVTTAQRTTLILRDIPKSTPEQDIKGLFSNPEAIEGVRSDIGDTWFVSFSDEDAAKAAYAECQTKTFNDKPVKARIKSENLLKSFLPPQQANADQQPAQPTMYPPYPQYAGQAPAPMMGYPYFMTMPYVPAGGPAPFPITPFPLPDYIAHGQPPMMPPDHGGRGRGRGRGGYPPHHGGGRGRAQGRGNHPNMNYQGNQGAKSHAQPVQLTPKDFPPLPSASQPLTGYTKDFVKYNKEQIIEVLSELAKSEVPRPEGIPSDCPVLGNDYNNEIELTRNAPPAPSTPSSNEKKYSDVAKEKSFAEAAITAKDIKPPEKPRRSSNKKATAPRERADSKKGDDKKGGRGGGRGAGGGGRGGGGRNGGGKDTNGKESKDNGSANGKEPKDNGNGEKPQQPPPAAAAPAAAAADKVEKAEKPAN